jgi:hypothetical protein
VALDGVEGGGGVGSTSVRWAVGSGWGAAFLFNEESGRSIDKLSSEIKILCFCFTLICCDLV